MVKLFGYLLLILYCAGIEGVDEDITVQGFNLKRQKMINEQLLTRGIKDITLLKAMAEVKREEFVPANLKAYAYFDGPLPIGFNQTISQPYIVALMLEAAELNPGSKVLDVGAGSGYAAAISSKLAKEVYALEIIPELAKQAEDRLKHLGYHNVTVILSDGSQGYPSEAPYDVILVAAQSKKIPLPLLEQLKEGGRLIIPVGEKGWQTLTKITKLGDRNYRSDVLEEVNFVPLIQGQ